MVLPVGPVCAGIVRANDTDWSFVPSDTPGGDPLSFQFWSQQSFYAGEDIVFTVIAGPFAPQASDVSSVATLEDVALAVSRLARRQGRTEDANELERQLAALYQ
jgi:hypothetical protein